MRRYTTPTYTFTISGVDLSSMDVYVTFKQGSTILTIEDCTVTYADETSTIEVSLTQAQTASFIVGKDCKVQVNAINIDGDRLATKERTVKVKVNLLEEVITYDS